jgi:hypothetical protein
MERHDAPATLSLVAFASLGAAAIHFAVIGEHFQEYWLFGVFFASVAWAQVGWAALVALRPSRAVLVVGGLSQASLVALYAVTRTAGIPLGPEPRVAEAVGSVDLFCTALEVLAAAGALWLAFRPVRAARAPRRHASTIATGLAIAVAAATSLALASATGEGSTMDMASDSPPATVSTDAPASTAPAGGADSMPDMGDTDAAAPVAVDPASLATTSPAGPIQLAVTMPDAMAPGMEMAEPPCTATPTPAQVTAAVDLVDRTVAGTAPYRSLDAARAAGYAPVTLPGQPVVHYVSRRAYLATTSVDDVLDPTAPQSLVYANTSHGPALVAAMFIMPAAAHAAPPMPGGCLTQWHVHTNLCFDASRTVVGAQIGTRSCPAGSAVQVTQPMLHVWLAPVPGGPLAVEVPPGAAPSAAEQLPPANPAAEKA